MIITKAPGGPFGRLLDGGWRTRKVADEGDLCGDVEQKRAGPQRVEGPAGGGGWRVRTRA